MRDVVLCGDAREVLAGLADASVDAVVTDPPYALTDKQGGSKGFMGAAWDTGHVAHDPAFWAAVLRVVTPGAFLLAFGGTRTYHRLACAIEEAGWECRDMLNWLQGSGFPKSKSCLKPSHEPIVLAKAPGPLQPLQIDACRVAGPLEGDPARFARTDGGWAVDFHTPPVVRAEGRWPPNALFSHVGGPDGCQPAGVRRVRGNGHHPSTRGMGGLGTAGHSGQQGLIERHLNDEAMLAYACVDGCPIKALDEQAGPRTSGGYPPQGAQRSHVATYGRPNERGEQRFRSSTGSVSRFFPTFGGAPEPEDAVPFRYVPKASRREREAGLDDAESVTKAIYGAGITSADQPGTADGGGPRAARNHHPCVKPLTLMAWLVKLVTVPGGVVLDPFCGSGTTCVACVREGLHFIAIDQDEHYCEIARRRVAHAREEQSGPLFAGPSAAAQD